MKELIEAKELLKQKDFVWLKKLVNKKEKEIVEQFSLVLLSDKMNHNIKQNNENIDLTLYEQWFLFYLIGSYYYSNAIEKFKEHAELLENDIEKYEYFKELLALLWNNDYLKLRLIEEILEYDYIIEPQRKYDFLIFCIEQYRIDVNCSSQNDEGKSSNLYAMKEKLDQIWNSYENFKTIVSDKFHIEYLSQLWFYEVALVSIVDRLDKRKHHESLEFLQSKIQEAMKIAVKSQDKSLIAYVSYLKSVHLKKVSIYNKLHSINDSSLQNDYIRCLQLTLEHENEYYIDAIFELINLYLSMKNSAGLETYNRFNSVIEEKYPEFLTKWKTLWRELLK